MQKLKLPGRDYPPIHGGRKIGLFTGLSKTLINIVFLLMITPLTLLQAGTFEIKSDFTLSDIGKDLEILADPGGKLPLKDLRDPQKSQALKWFSPGKKKIGLGYTNTVHWVRFQVTNSTKQNQKWYLEQTYPLLDKMSLYYPDGKGEYQEYKTGDFLPFKKRPINHRTFVFPLEIASGKTLTYYVRFQTEGSLNIVLRAWSADYFLNRKGADEAPLWLYYGFIVVMAVYNLFIFFSIRDRSYMYYVLYLVSLLLIAMSLDGTAYQYLWPNLIWWGNFSVMYAIISVNLSFMLFCRYFINVKELSPPLARLQKYFISFTFASSIILVGVTLAYLAMGIPGAAYRPVARISVILAFVSVFSHLVATIYLATVKKSRQATLFVVSFGVYFLGAMAIVLDSLGILTGTFLGSYGMQIGSTLNVVLLSFGLADRINIMKGKLEVLNASLEDKVQERTQQLQITLDDVKKLKDHQDGDYFLTSLLLNPFLKNSETSSNFEMDMKLKQFKSFSFRGRNYQIGGDLCLVERIQIRGRDFKFFVNADAMGKSMQGAGGALVLAASLKSHLNQADSGASRNSLPELWLRSAYLDLQKLFISFDGSMMASMVIGLVDEETGVVYYVNLEHPGLVIYRKGKASFIEGEQMLMKAGIPGQERKLRINLFEMQSGDVLIAGSDGRDDLIMGDNPTDVSEINTDETLFLRSVEKADGNLNVLLEEIERMGKLKDDLSLLSISCSHNRENRIQKLTLKEKKEIQNVMKLLQENKSHQAMQILAEISPGEKINLRAIKLLSGLLYRKKRYSMYAELIMRYYELFPGGTRHILRIIDGLALSRNYAGALQFVKILLLRDPRNMDAVSRAAYVYFRLGKLEHTRFYVNILKRNPQMSERLKTLGTRLERKLKKTEEQTAQDQQQFQVSVGKLENALKK